MTSASSCSVTLLNVLRCLRSDCHGHRLGYDLTLQVAAVVSDVAGPGACGNVHGRSRLTGRRRDIADGKLVDDGQRRRLGSGRRRRRRGRGSTQVYGEIRRTGNNDIVLASLTSHSCVSIVGADRSCRYLARNG